MKNYEHVCNLSKVLLRVSYGYIFTITPYKNRSICRFHLHVDILYPSEYREKSSESRADGEGDIVRGRDVFHGTFLHILWRLRSYIITAFRKAELASNVTAPFLFSEAPNIVCGGCAVVKQAGPCQDDRNLFGPLPFGRPHPLPAERRRPQYRASVKRRVRDPNRT